MLSPTGCTKQLISVACSEVPAALMMRPAPIAPAFRLAWNCASHFSRSASASTEARARATRANRSSASVSPGLRYFSCRTSRVIGWIARTAGASSRFMRCLLHDYAEGQDAAHQPFHQFVHGPDLRAEGQQPRATEEQ